MTSHPRDRYWLEQALLLSGRCTVPRIYCVGCVIVDQEGAQIAQGYTGELAYPDGSSGSSPHAEEIALSRMPATTEGATLYSTLEPCSERLSGLECCSSRIISHGIARVVFGVREPFDSRLQIHCRGEDQLREAGIAVVQLFELEERCLAAIKRGDT
ncbi:MAG: dCMP deaminase [Deltaproteobacteria bacterium]|nr:dCMP deaminase [Deltaproteobacteria bacterium]